MTDKVEYIGDGTYVSFDGFEFTLMADDRLNPTAVVYLRPQTLETLVRVCKMFQDEASSNVEVSE